MPAARRKAASPTLLGRAQELASVSTTEAVLLSIVGPPGIGKTTLAKAVLATEARGVFVDLSTARTLEEMVSALATGLGMALRDDVNPERFASALNHRGPITVVLDNFEQLVDEAATFIGAIAAGLENARLIVTTRQALRVEHESVLQLGPLDVAAAVELLQARAGRHQPAALSDEDAAAVVQRLDGNPLAIELAAGRLELLTPGELVRRLDRSVLSLDGAKRRGERRSSLRSSLETSWALMQPWEQRAFMQCGVFRGGFTLETAESVVEIAPHSVLDALESLCDRSLVQLQRSRGGNRFSMFESIREFALEKLRESSALDVTTARHAEALTAAAWERMDQVQHTGGDIDAALAWLTAEHANLLAAHHGMRASHPVLAARAAVALVPRLTSMGPASLLDGMMTWVIESIAPSTDARIAGIARNARGKLYLLQGMFDDALKDLHEARTILEEHGTPAQYAASMWLAAGALCAQGELDEAERLSRKVLELTRRHALRFMEGNARSILGLVAAARGDLEEACAQQERARLIHQSLGARRYVGIALANLAAAHAEQGNLRVAGTCVDESFVELEAAGEHMLGGKLLIDLARIHWLQQRPLDAAQVLDRALAHAREWGDLETQAAVWMQRAEQALDGNDPESAFHPLVRAIAILPNMSGPAQRIRALRLKARAHAMRQEPGLAGKTLRDALALAVATGNASQVAQLREMLGEPSVEKAQEPALHIAEDGRWFELEGGARHALPRRRHLRLILRTLAERRVKEPGLGIPAHRLFELAWPGEKIRPESAAQRLYTAIRELRQMGLDSVLIRQDDGYLLRPDAPVRWPAREG